MAEPIPRGVYDELPYMFDGSVLTALVDQTISIPYLEGWVAAGEPHDNVSISAVGTRQLHKCPWSA